MVYDQISHHSALNMWELSKEKDNNRTKRKKLRGNDKKQIFKGNKKELKKQPSINNGRIKGKEAKGETLLLVTPQE